MTKSPGLSVCMIVKNESANLADSLACFTSFADELIVVDTGSADNTKEIAARFTPLVYDFEWIDDFSAARNFAKSKATRSYHLWVDADDRIDSQNQLLIESLKSDFDSRKAFWFILQNDQGNLTPTSCRQLRCFPNAENIQFERPVHEQAFESVLRAGLEVVFTEIVIVHLGYMTNEARLAKAMRNMTMMEKQRAAGAGDGGMLFSLALTYAPLGREKDALECMADALERFEKEGYNHHLIPEAYLFQARVAFEMGDYDKSLRNLAAAGSLAGSNPRHNYQMGILYQQMGRHRLAVDALRQVGGKKYVPDLYPSQPLPNGSELLLHIAYSLYCLNDQKGALELINSSEAGRGRSWEWMGTKAFAFQNLGLAHIAFEAALRFGGLEPISWARLGAVYKLRGYAEKARQCFERSGMSEPLNASVPAA
ncbi:MAG: glycosyltransferase [Syntrophobacteraceae bacterium]|nr:glycosyltransferase [Syntrophobacteraceae bacterium]